MKENRISIVLVVIIGIALGITTASCKKEKATVAQIKVVDTDGNAVENAMVRLFGDPTIDTHGEMVINDTMYTDKEGSVIYNFTDRFNLGQSGFAVLNIETLSDPFVGEGIIKIEEEKTNEATVILQ